MSERCWQQPLTINLGRMRGITKGKKGFWHQAWWALAVFADSHVTDDDLWNERKCL